MCWFPGNSREVQISVKKTKARVAALDQGSSTGCSHDSSTPVHPLLLDHIHQATLHQSLPIESARTLQEDFIFPCRRLARWLEGDQRIDQGHTPNAVRVAYNDRSMRPDLGKVAAPDLPLLHSDSSFTVDATHVILLRLLCDFQRLRQLIK
jgi:hypothetical protein